jgi:hypothetical protein
MGDCRREPGCTVRLSAGGEGMVGTLEGLPGQGRG